MRPLINGEVGGGTAMEKQSLADVKYLWNVWEIHFLILTSLFLQVVLFFFAGMRRRSSSTILRIVLWLAYLSADSVATFVLGHLMVHAEGSRRHLMYFWAPFVLVHLGGQDTITSFSKQDNELWTRHLLNLATQVAVAGYVVAKASWPDARLRAAMVIMFLSGCFKYAERTFCLYLSRPLGLYSTSLKRLKRSLKEMSMYKRILIARDLMISQYTSRMLEMMFKGSSTRRVTRESTSIMSVDSPHSEAWAILKSDEISRMFAELKSRAGRCRAYKHVGASLEDCYRQLHTKILIREPLFELVLELFGSHGGISCRSEVICEYLICSPMIVSYYAFHYVSAPIALVLFMASEKRDRLNTSSADITVSYILLVGAIALDVCSFFSNLGYLIPGTHVADCIQPAVCRKQWAEELSQYNMIQTSTLETQGSSYKTVAAWLFDNTTHVPVNKSRTPIKEIILDNLLCWGEAKEWKITSFRGKLSLQKWMQKHQDPDSARTGKALLAKSIGVDFPVSVLIWHIATDMCYYCEDNSNTTGTHQMNEDNKQVSRELSNYIMYLVFKCGVKRTDSSQIVHDRTGIEIRDILQKHGQQVKKQSEKDAVTELFAPKKAEHQDSNHEIQKDEEEQQDSSAIEVQKLQEKGKTVAEIRKPEELDEEQQDSSMVTEIQKPIELDYTQDTGVAEIQKQNQLDHEQDSMEAESQKHAERGDSNLQELPLSTLEAFGSTVLPHARDMARELLSIKDAAERWHLIVGVWSEMLFYVAPRCGGAFHYEHLTTGGEFVTHVLVLMQKLGPFLPPPGSD